MFYQQGHYSKKSSLFATNKNKKGEQMSISIQTDHHSILVLSKDFKAIHYRIYFIILFYSKQGTFLDNMDICRCLGERHHIVNDGVLTLLQKKLIKVIHQNGKKCLTINKGL